MSTTRGRRERPESDDRGGATRRAHPRPPSDPPRPYVELDRRVIASIDGAPLFAWAEAAVSAIDARIAGDLIEEPADDHDVLTHYSNGVELVDDVAQSKRNLPEDTVPMLSAIQRPFTLRAMPNAARPRLLTAPSTARRARAAPQINIQSSASPS